MANKHIPIEYYKTIWDTGARPGQLISGIGYDGSYHIGAIIRVLDEIVKGRPTIDGRIEIIEPGNLKLKIPMVNDFKNVQILAKSLPNVKLQCKNFVLKATLRPCQKRFSIGDKLIVTKDTNSYYRPGDMVSIYQILKYPDDRDPTMSYYEISAPGQPIKEKLDSGMEFV